MKQRSATVCVAILFVCAAARADAQPGPTEKQAASHYRQGEAYLAQGLHDKAIAEFRAAYALVPRPVIVFHIGRALEAKGDVREALAHFRKFLAEQPDGPVAADARQRVAALEKTIADEDAAARARAEEAERKRQQDEQKRAAEAQSKQRAKVEAYVAQAKVFLDQGVPGRAAGQYQNAYDLDRNPEYLYDIGDAYRLTGEKEKARDYFLRYTSEVSAGPRADEARTHIGVLTREIELGDATAARTGSPGAPDDSKRARRAKKREGVNWLAVSVGVAAIAAGVATDTLPATASNTDVEALDFVPVGLYALGGTLLLTGVF